MANQVAHRLCRDSGYNFGKKIPANGLFGAPLRDEKTLFVLKDPKCSGFEDSFFSCELGPWMEFEERCDDGDILTVVCADSQDLLHFEVSLIGNLHVTPL